MIGFYIVGAVVSWIIIAGLANASFLGEFKTASRQDVGFFLGWGLLAAPLWPITLIMTFFITGFAEHGWSLKLKK